MVKRLPTYFSFPSLQKKITFRYISLKCSVLRWRVLQTMPEGAISTPLSPTPIPANAIVPRRIYSWLFGEPSWRHEMLQNCSWTIPLFLLFSHYWPMSVILLTSVSNTFQCILMEQNTRIGQSPKFERSNPSYHPSLHAVVRKPPQTLHRKALKTCKIRRRVKRF